MSETKNKIIHIANELFARKGFHATSVRDISLAAKVNISAVNYHFGSKENLYWVIIESNYLEMGEEIQELSQGVLSTENLIGKIFDYFIQSNSKLSNFFKVILNDGIDLPEKPLTFFENPDFGPPGSKVIKERIKSEIPDVKNEDLDWAVKMILSQLVHFSVMVNTSIIKLKFREDKNMSKKKIKSYLMRSCRSYLYFLSS